jgi:hypothetical protein
MTDEYSRYRRSFRRYFIAGCALALIATSITIWKIRREKWTVLSSDKSARLSVEEAVYESSASHQVFLRCRLDNLSPHSLRLDLKNTRCVFAVPKWEVNEGTDFAPVNGMMQIDIKHHGDSLANACKNGKLHVLKPGASVEFYRAVAKADRAAIERSYQSQPLWERAKTLWPYARNALHLILRVNSAVVFPNDRCSHLQFVNGNVTAFPWPLHWKTLPENMRLMSEEKRTG